jgi:hypothetical protein
MLESVGVSLRIPNGLHQELLLLKWHLVQMGR